MVRCHLSIWGAFEEERIMKRLLAGWHLHAFAFSSDTVMNAADSEKGGKKGKGVSIYDVKPEGGLKIYPKFAEK